MQLSIMDKIDPFIPVLSDPNVIINIYLNSHGSAAETPTHQPGHLLAATAIMNPASLVVMVA